MRTEQVILQKKAEALNAIRKICHPLTKHHYTYYEGEGSRKEQMFEDIQQIITRLEKDLLELKQKAKQQ